MKRLFATPLLNSLICWTWIDANNPLEVGIQGQFVLTTCGYLPPTKQACRSDSIAITYLVVRLAWGFPAR